MYIFFINERLNVSLILVLCCPPDEIKVQPTSPDLQSSLVRLYLDWSKDEPRKLDEAYKYLSEVEARRPFTHSLVWYRAVMDVLEVRILTGATWHY